VAGLVIGAFGGSLIRPTVERAWPHRIPSFALHDHLPLPMAVAILVMLLGLVLGFLWLCCGRQLRASALGQRPLIAFAAVMHLNLCDWTLCVWCCSDGIRRISLLKLQHQQLP
jgi:hypothetical protein